MQHYDSKDNFLKICVHTKSYTLKRCIALLLLWISCLLPAYANGTFSDRPDVHEFIEKMVQRHHFNETELITLFNSVKMHPTVMHYIRAPLEKNTWNRYQMLFVTEWRIREGVYFWKRNNAILRQVEKQYGVPASIIVATLGIETKYGHSAGGYRVIDALSNVAFSNSPRATYFKSELELFLELSREQHWNPSKVLGSYAGAMGQPQFMPSSYREYAISFSGHPSIDLTHNEADAIASVANYYKKHGWHANEPITISASRVNRSTLAVSLTQKELQKAQVLLKNHQAKIITLDGYWGNEYWIGFHNFGVIKRYNSSDLYAMAVFQLSHYISELREQSNDA